MAVTTQFAAFFGQFLFLHAAMRTGGPCAC